MAEWELIQDRILSGKGVLQVPTDVRKSRAYVLFCDVIRDPRSRYLNLTWNPPRGRYGNLAFVRGKYVVDSKTIDFEHQCFDGINDISGQTLLAVKCAYSGTLQSIANLGLALNAIPVSIINTIVDYESLRLSWDEVRLTAYADTALQLRLYRISYDACEETNDADMIAPVPDPPVTKVPSGTPVPNDKPYNEDNSDNGNTAPYPGDEPTLPEPCVTVIRGAGLDLSTCGQANNFGDYSYNGYAELRATTISGCAGLQVFLDGVSLGAQQIYHPSAIILSRVGDCVPPPEV